MEVIAVDQDPLGKQGIRIVGGDLSLASTDLESTTNIWGRPLQDGTWAVVFLNVGNKTQELTCDNQCFKAMGFEAPVTLVGRDLWQHMDVWKSNGSLTYSTNVTADGGVEMLKFSKM
eukprot:Phypoly_transcript_30087.p1 GENE.Phypoly_transcript_30087~~Phypoly_transcript_30087.p1  ORF type:complete len:126 (+),score=17.88 Phypoly_transcript_30087:29-379(+)